MTWKDVKFKQYLEVTEIQQREDIEYNRLLDITAVLNDVNVDDITISNFKEYAENIKFITEDIPVAEIKDAYDNYTLQKELSSMSMKQYIDFNNYAKTNDYVGVLSVFLIPKGKQYNEGYDIEEVREYVLNMSCVDVITIYAFFLMQSQIYITYTHSYLKEQQQMILTKRKKERRQKMSRMEIFQLYHRYAKISIYRTLRCWKCQLSRCSIYLTLLFKSIIKK